MHLAAYYPYNMETEPPMPGTLSGVSVGAYYPYNMETEPPMPGTLNGLAGDEALKLLGARTPALYATYWAEQKTDAVWSPFRKRQGCDLYEVTDAIVKRSQANSFGGELANLGVVFARPLPLERVRRAFVGTPFGLEAVEAVFARSDLRPYPRMVFVAKLSPRELDDSEGGKVSLDAAASSLGGRLVLVEPVMQRDAYAPLPAFEPAFRRQFQAPARSVQGYGAATSEQGQAHFKALVPSLIVFGGLAAYLMYRESKKAPEGAR